MRRARIVLARPRHTPVRRRLVPVIVAAALAGSLLPMAPAAAATVPTGFTVTEQGLGFGNATSLAVLPDGRVLIAQQSGQLRVVRDGALLAPPLLTVAVATQGERGLLGVTPHPQFTTNGFVFVHYTVPGTAGRAPFGRVERWRVPAGRDVADPASRTVVLDLPGQTGTIHIGGAIHFGTDGKLLVAVGDNGDGARSQQLTNPFGKVLRIEPDTGAAATGNPFLATPNVWARRIWTYGLRNPFTFGVARSGRVHINDVGQSTWEEIDRGQAGANYGWPTSEGPLRTAGFTAPIEVYSHAGPRCSIAGGDFYDPNLETFPTAYVGDYFYGDFCAGWVRRYDVGADTSTDFGTGFGSVVDLAVGNRGRLHVLSRTSPSVGSSSLWRIDHPGA